MSGTHSQLEELFIINVRAFGRDLPTPTREYRFHPPRKWQIDFAWPQHKLAVEVEGGIYSGGRHNRLAGFLKDIEKYNQLSEDGWRLLRFASPHVTQTPKDMVDQIRRLLQQEQAPQSFD